MADATTPPADESATPNERWGQLTPALIREVTEKVYELWLRDLRIERERLRGRGRGDETMRGGQYG
ncbi:MAG: hypothetical protein KDE58_26025 [Caldilineaceae bacterium]|nr:hypothetical protein [Caldilineaceae bacterium]